MINPHTGREFVKDFFRDLARDKPCLIRIAALEGYECATPDTTVLCHISLPGIKAMGKKACTPDLLGAWGCGVCQDVELYHYHGMARTLDEIRKLGYLP
jgi:hypothetical protein